MQYWPFLLLLLAVPAWRLVWNAQWRQSRGGMSFTGITVLLVVVAVLWTSASTAPQPGTVTAPEAADYRDGDSALRALLD